ncbi:MAG: ABC transporter permease [Alphaproteobacteria bacterium]
MSQIYLVARREFLAYIGTWGFWISLLTAPLLLGALMFGPVLLARAEPSRIVVIVADRPADAALTAQTFDAEARDAARTELKTYLDAAAPAFSNDVIVAFDAAADRAHAIAAARALVSQRAPRVLSAMPALKPRYLIAPAPAATIEDLKPYLVGQRAVSLAGAAHPLYGALNIRRDAANVPHVEYWSVNLSSTEPAQIAQRAMQRAMQREAVAAKGLDPSEADRLDAFSPDITQFDPRPARAEQVGVRQRAPFIASLLLTFVLWTVVFSVANMLLNGVIEEKSNKILDSLLTTVSPFDLLIGKLLGVAAVSATLLGLWGAIGGALLSNAALHSGHGLLSDLAGAFLDPRLIVAFIAGFSAGYLLYGAIFLALGSLCDSIQDAQALVGPVALVLALPVMLLAPALENPNSPIIAAASWFPLFTPFVILLRAPSELSWTEIAGMTALVGVTIIIVLILAARIFHAGVVNQMSAASLFGRKSKD